MNRDNTKSTKLAATQRYHGRALSMHINRMVHQITLPKTKHREGDGNSTTSNDVIAMPREHNHRRPQIGHSTTQQPLSSTGQVTHTIPSPPPSMTPQTQLHLQPDNPQLPTWTKKWRLQQVLVVKDTTATRSSIT